jgi:hypothetical protein
MPGLPDKLEIPEMLDFPENRRIELKVTKSQVTLRKMEKNKIYIKYIF